MNQPSPTDLYVAGRMSEEESRLFEEDMLANPAIAAEVDVRRRIKSGLKLLESRGELAAFSSPPRTRLFPLAAAASAVLVVFAAAWYLQQRSGTDFQPAAAQSLPGATQTYWLVATRSPQAPVLEVEGTTRTIALRTLLDDRTPPPYSMRIEPTSAGQGSIELGGVSIVDGGQLEGRVDADALATGRYQLIVITGAGASQPLPFEIRK